MGQRDEEALLGALSLEPAYLGVVASRRRYAEIREVVAPRAPAAALARVRNPAGLDLGAKRPEEIALSILAEIVKVRQEAQGGRGEPAAAERGAEDAIDPICGMTVAVATARFRAEHAGRTWYFCNARCRERFLAAPERYAGAEASP
jgi:xanthine dehydrogenase accessory factor